MNLIALNPASLILGQPLPFALRGTDGSLLAHKGYVLRRDEIDGLLGISLKRVIIVWVLQKELAFILNE